MKTISQSLTANVLDEVLARESPADVNQQELAQFKAHLAGMDERQVRNLSSELKSAARTRGRRIILREQLLDRLGTSWLRKHQEIVEAELAKIEVAKDIVGFNILELELSGQTWRLDKSTRVLHLSEQAQGDPLINLIKRQQHAEELEVLGSDNSMDDETLATIFGLR
ncbi:MAG: hypothetical protein HW397_351 [Dehalococcoidia bacterium]|nr:hypothetical protein [Dehalococcoidia bacterium]